MSAQKKAGVSALAVMDAMVLSAERLAAGEVVTSCAATVEVARQTRAAVAELIEIVEKYASECASCDGKGFFMAAGRRHECSQCRAIRAALARVQGGAL